MIEAEGRKEIATAVSAGNGTEEGRRGIETEAEGRRETEAEGRRETEAEGRRETVIEAEGRRETAEAVTGETVAGGMPRMRAPDKAGVPGRGTVLSRRLIS